MYRENARNQNRKLAKECRIALEKNYGGAIPLPECMLKKESPKKRAKRASLKKRIKISLKVAITSERKIDLFEPMRTWIAQKNTQNLPNNNSLSGN